MDPKLEIPSVQVEEERAAEERDEGTAICDTVVVNTITGGESYFDGGLFQLIGWSILGALITALTLGICFPWALCMCYGWQINHTVIEGRRLHFNGKAINLFGSWIKWLFLCIITLGIYTFWLNIAIEKWKVKNTTFAN